MDLDDFLIPLDLQFEKLCQLAARFSDIYSHLALHSTDQFLATPVKLPRGHEHGKFLAIDCGGSNLRVCWIELLSDRHEYSERIRRRHEKSWPIEDHLKMDNAEDLFRWIGDCIAEVIAKQTVDDREEEETVPVGVTFSFPMIQTSIDQATLMPMGKGFAITSDLNLGRLLLDGYEPHVSRCSSIYGAVQARKLPKIEIAAITNDTVATLASLSYSAKAIPNAHVAMGLIMGTGTNATIPMQLNRLHEKKRSLINVPGAEKSDDATVVVNTEWTIKGSLPPLKDLGIITKWDRELDSQCEAPGFQPFEYMTAGRYLGELVRLIVYDYLVNIQRIDPEDLPEALRKRNAVSTAFLSTVVARAHSSKHLLPKLEISFPAPSKPKWAWDERTAKTVMVIANRVLVRSARLVAAASIGLLACANEIEWKGDAEPQTTCSSRRTRPEELIIAYTGGTISQYPNYRETCQDMLDRLLNELTPTDRIRKVTLYEAKDGGVIGAGVLAGTAWHLSGT